MSDMCSLLELYALGGLSADESTVFERHLQTCVNCRHELKEFKPISEALLFDFEQVPPPSGMRDRVLSHVLDVPQHTPEEVQQRLLNASDASTSHTSDTRTRDSHPRVQAKIATRVWWSFSAAAIMLALLVAGVTYSVAPKDGGSPLGKVSRTISLNAKIPGAQAKLWISRGHNSSQMLIHFSHLKPVKGTQVYQVWLIQTGSTIPYSAGVFTPNNQGNAVFASIMPSGSYQTVAITLEPKAIDKKPLGPIVFQGNT